MESMAPSSVSGDAQIPPLSKNKLKKLRRDQEWEENRTKRKAKRKEKVQEKKQRKRADREVANLSLQAQPNKIRKVREGDVKGGSNKSKCRQCSQLPITLVLDCSFDDLMMDKERKSLGSQITRCYSDNHKAPYQVHLAISSFGGHLKERFDGLLAGQYRSWRNVRFLEGDFVEAAMQAKEWMRSYDDGKLAGVWSDKHQSEQTSEDQVELGEVVYLSSDSPDTLTELRPYSTYIIGGLVDRNRHKGVCYKRAVDRGIRTAKLPIGDYMEMTSRFVLATNHVAEIMLRWLELGDWGKAFLQVVPKRKGGVLKNGSKSANGGDGDEEVGGERDEEGDDEADGRPQGVADAEVNESHQGPPLPTSGAGGEDGRVGVGTGKGDVDVSAVDEAADNEDEDAGE